MSDAAGWNRIAELEAEALDMVDRIIELEDVRYWALDEIARLERENARLGRVNAILSTYALPLPVTIFPATL